MKILLAVETLYPGGAEMFALRMASELGKKHDVILFRLYEEAVDENLVSKYPQNFHLAWPVIGFDRVWRKIDRALRLLRIDFSFRDVFVKRALSRVMQQHKTEVIHSNQFKVDYLAAQVRTKQVLVVTLHGDYNTFDTLKNSTHSILNFSAKLQFIVSNRPAFVFIADAQLDFFNAKRIRNQSFTKIYNGYFGSVPENIKRDDTVFTFGMIARGIKEKGWQILIDAFLKIQEQFPHARLLLVGDSAYLKDRKLQYAEHTRIHFAGHSNNPLEWISKMDVGLLPSYYSSESLPTSVIEYLYCGIPVIASDAGEIRNMISTPTGLAGRIITLKQNDSDAEQLSLLMKDYLTDQSIYKMDQQRARTAFEKFDMEKCTQAYEQVYRTAMQKELA